MKKIISSGIFILLCNLFLLSTTQASFYLLPDIDIFIKHNADNSVDIVQYQESNLELQKYQCIEQAKINNRDDQYCYDQYEIDRQYYEDKQIRIKELFIDPNQVGFKRIGHDQKGYFLFSLRNDGLFRLHARFGITLIQETYDKLLEIQTKQIKDLIVPTYGMGYNLAGIVLITEDDKYIPLFLKYGIYEDRILNKNAIQESIVQGKPFKPYPVEILDKRVTDIENQLILLPQTPIYTAEFDSNTETHIKVWVYKNNARIGAFNVFNNNNRPYPYEPHKIEIQDKIANVSIMRQRYNRKFYLCSQWNMETMKKVLPTRRCNNILN